MRTFFLNRATGKHEITDPAELLREIERKDALFRIAQASFSIVLLLLIGLLLGLSYNLQSQNHQLLDNQQSMLKEDLALSNQIKSAQANSEKSNDTKLTDLQHHIDCIVSLFTQPNRANLSITNIQTCQLSLSSASGGSTGSTKSR